MAEFDAWAAYYDVIHQGLPGEAEFYTGQAVRLGGKTLELGCGTGRVAIAMAMSGVDVTGLDHSKAMLAVCGAKLEAVGPTKGALRLVHGDMSDFDLGEAFDFIAMPYRSFMHLDRPAQQRRCLERVRAHLKDSGVFILNTWVPKRSAMLPGPDASGDDAFQFVEDYALPDSTEILRYHHRAAYDEFRQRIVEEHRIEEVDAAGSVLHAETLPLIRVWTTPREMDNLVRLCGFEVEAVFGDFDCTPLTASSTEMIWVLKKDA